MDPAAYHAWYQSPRGAWIAERERRLLAGLLDPRPGETLLDLGRGSGRDVYLLSRLVGEGGEVVGVDMTAEQLGIAERHRDYHRERFGYKRSNVRFLEGRIEHLDALGLEPGGFDLIVSNCVINLSPDKSAVLAQAFSLLKPGGELYFSDVYADRRVPAELAADPILYGECLAGALYWNDFLHLARGPASRTRGWWRTVRSASVIRRWRRGSSPSASTRRPIGCSRCRAWIPIARTTARRWPTAAPCHATGSSGA